MVQIQTNGDVTVERVTFRPKSAWLNGTDEPLTFRGAIREIEEQIERHLNALIERVTAAHRDSVRALERGETDGIADADAPWSDTPTTVVHASRSGVVTRCEEEVTLTIRMRLNALADSLGEAELSHAALAALRAR
jgi:hypothetical protein